MGHLMSVPEDTTRERARSDQKLEPPAGSNRQPADYEAMPGRLRGIIGSSSSMELDYLQSKFKSRLYSLAEGPAFEGIHALKPNYLNSRFIGVTDQFLSHAAEYDANYFNYDLWQRLLKLALERVRPTAANPEVLDVGSGSGNSVLPMLGMFGGARVVATDISPQLLGLLRTKLASFPQRQERCGVVC